jgi:proline iminopeptidase
MASEMADLDRIRESLQLGSAAVLGHSWGTLLALEYAVRHPDRVSQLILLNPAPASAADFAYFRKVYAAKLGDDLARLRAAASTPGYKEADAEAVADYYRIHFKAALTRPEHVETIVARLKATFTKDAVLKARAVEERLYKETWLQDGYDLLPKLAALKIPTLVVYSEHDFIPPESALHIAEATPDARVVALKTCGHFSFFDCPNEVRDAIDGLFRGR